MKLFLRHPLTCAFFVLSAQLPDARVASAQETPPVENDENPTTERDPDGEAEQPQPQPDPDVEVEPPRPEPDAAPDSPATSPAPTGTIEASRPSDAPPPNEEDEVGEEGEADEPSFEATAEVDAPPRETTKHVLKREQLTTIPGTRGDALRAIEVMPGVARTPFGANAGPPLLRGSPYSESLVLIDGSPIPLLYHFGGLTSFFNSHLLESVTLYPGNYSARYGRAAGGVVEARVRDPRSDGFHLMLELSAIDSFALTEGPLGQKTSFALAARRSNVDLFIDALLTDDSTAVIAAPVYWDYQAILAHELDAAHKLRVLIFGGGDAFELHFGEALADDPALAGDFGARVSTHRLQLELTSHLAQTVEQQVMVSAGPSPGSGQLGSTHYDVVSWDAHARAEWSFLLAPWLRLDTGIDVQALHAKFVYEGPPPNTGEGLPPQGSLASDSQAPIDSKLESLRSAIYIESSFRPTTELLLVPGVRFDHFSESGELSVDPRISSRLELFPRTTLKTGVGYYSQPPQYWESMPGFGNADAKPYRTLQTSLGLEQALGERAQIGVDGFYKHWRDRIVDTPGGAPPRYVNEGTGDAYGVELLLDLSVTERSRTYLAYTLSRSTREDGEDAPTRLFDGDQTHNLSLATTLELGLGWQAGARFRYVTGNPYSTVTGAVYDASTDTYRPLYAEINDSRNRDFHQLDLRIDKRWDLGPVDLTTYLEIMNVYNRENEEGRRYSFDYRESSSVIGMPFFPNVGIRGEL